MTSKAVLMRLGVTLIITDHYYGYCDWHGSAVGV